jgi:SNF2 family DNA or RNA helicase
MTRQGTSPTTVIRRSISASSATEDSYKTKINAHLTRLSQSSKRTERRLDSLSTESLGSTKTGTPSGGKSKQRTLAGRPSNRGSLEPWLKDDVDFYPHQIEGVKWLKDKKGALLADDMGLGKTLQMLAVYSMHIWKVNKLRPGEATALLVVVPVSLRDNWEDEIEKFTRIPMMKLEGSPAKRAEQLQVFKTWEWNKILVVNYEQVAPHIVDLNDMGFKMVIADEAHTIKNPKAKRTKAFLSLSIPRRFMLTGTPILKHVDDLWTLLEYISPGQWGSYWSFTHKYCVYGGYKNKQIVGIKNEQQLINKLNDVMLRRTKEEVLDLPDVQYITRKVSLGDRQKKIYNYIVDNMKLDREDGNEPELIEYDIVKEIRLRQVCATTATVLSHGEDTSTKLDLAIEDAMEILENGNKLVVFTQFKPVVAAYVERIKKACPNVPVYVMTGDVDKSKRQDMVKEWAARKGPAVIVGIIKVMGTGLNMTAARHAQFIDKEYAPGLNKQAVDRLNRIGASTTQSIQVFEYFVRNSAEARVERIIKSKIATSDLIVDNNNADFAAAVREAVNVRME